MSTTIFTFSITWSEHGVVSFANTDKSLLEKEVSAYLRADQDFCRFLSVLRSDVLKESDEFHESDVEFIQKACSPEHVLSIEDLNTLLELDMDDYRYSVGRMYSWGFEEHIKEDQKPSNIEFPGGLDQFKASAKRLSSLLSQSGAGVSNAQALEFLAKALYSKPYGEVKETLL